MHRLKAAASTTLQAAPQRLLEGHESSLRAVGSVRGSAV